MEQPTVRTYRLNMGGMLRHPNLWDASATGSQGCLTTALLLLLYLPSLLRSYLRVSPEGLELYYWPLYRLRAAWPEVVRLGTCKMLGLFPCDALYLDRPESQAREAFVREWGLAKRCVVPVGDFRGWPAGPLAADVGRYIPHILNAPPPSP